MTSSSLPQNVTVDQLLELHTAQLCATTMAQRISLGSDLLTHLCMATPDVQAEYEALINAGNLAVGVYVDDGSPMLGSVVRALQFGDLAAVVGTSSSGKSAVLFPAPRKAIQQHRNRHTNH